MLSINPHESKTPAAVLARQRILLLDDSVFDRRRIRRICAVMDSPVHLDEVASLQEFKAQASGMPYDFYILDCHLPVESGFSAFEFLWASGLARLSNVVMTSGIDAPESAATARGLGCDQFVEKTKLTAERLRALLDGSCIFTDAVPAEKTPQARGDFKTKNLMRLEQFETQSTGYALGADGGVVHLNTGYPTASAQSSQDLIDLTMQMLEEDEFVFRTR